MELQVNNYCEKIINNYLENMYLELMSLYNDNDLVMTSIYKAFEKIFLVDFDYLNFMFFKDKLEENIFSLIKKSNVNIRNDKSCKIDNRIYIFNFNLASYFNELDNNILFCIIIHKMELSKVSELIGYDEEYIKTRFLSIIRWMRVHFINVIKPKFVNENELELV